MPACSLAGLSRRDHAARSICSRFCINLRKSRIESHCIVRGIRGSPCRACRLRQRQADQQGRQRVRLPHGPQAELGRKQGRHLPPLPKDANLLEFTVSNNTPLSFFIDKNSLSVGDDGVIRYTVVVKSPAGARNVNYEGIRCDNYNWRLYASINEDQTDWDRTVENDFRRIENGELNAYHAALYQDYFCANKLPTGSAKQILSNIQMKRTAVSNYH